MSNLAYADRSPPSADSSPDYAVEAARRIVEVAQKSRVSPPEFTVEPASGDVGDTAEIDYLETVLGLDEKQSADSPFRSLLSVDLPITSGLYRDYSAAFPTRKTVRAEGAESYRQWRDDKRAPYVDALEDRLAALEAEVAEHIRDNHGGGRVARLEEALRAHLGDLDGGLSADEVMADLQRHMELARAGGETVPLSLPPETAGVIDCWHDDGKIYCTIMLPGETGTVYATTSAALAKHNDEVLGYAAVAGVDPLEVMGVLPVLSQVLGGGALVTQLCAASPAILGREEVRRGDTFVGSMVPNADPAVAAVMSLIQLCTHTKNYDACTELERLRSMPGGAALIERANRALAQARGVK